MTNKGLQWIFVLMLFSITACKKKNSADKKTNEVISNTGQIKDSVKSNNGEVDQKSLVDYYFQANGGSILYLKDGSMRSCARCDSDVAELLNTKAYYSYKAFDTFILENKSRTEFFDESGKIDRSWKIIKGIGISYDHELISYTEAPKNLKYLEDVKDTRLVIFEPEYKTFKDQNSKEAEEYFIAMDDWNWYSNELNESFQELKIKTQYLKSRYVSIPIENNEVLNIDTWSNINGTKTQALLYKKGHRPLIISIISSSNDFDEIKNYLKS